MSRERFFSWDAYGPVRFGMRLEDAEQHAGAATTPFNSTRNPGCDWVSFASLPNVLFMVESGIVTRADSKAGIPNILGIEYGMSVDQAKAKAPAAIVMPHKYDPGGLYLKMGSKDGKKAIVMETGEGKVDAIRAGLEPSVSYVEGCS